ncbi:hypothetical protein F1188_11195 [Roseospira marina]|uniref:Putative exodeoxyribonuclease 8 PDDEXK-like domain-containing protein n=1 Tax=Roseospira marina TaxID=140057 RepID=A0A5M6IB30_9PROT|nr:PD-(D/E)XK nuclease-like domain-containing protein [Roseospira marina]KAA5605456.1 hypothetical protein F1188_11195 [Roseospira marina]MBB4314544.1 hypothetical protein [Roseospira marina]MBB5088894.1 hypothetical protein [Roseospira marina]
MTADTFTIRPDPGGPIREPGFYRFDEDRYHDDPCDAPSLSSGTAKELLRKSPWHAWRGHPRLGGADEKRASRNMDLGSVVHALILGEGSDVEVIDASGYTTKAAREARDAARDAGKTPILAAEWDQAQAMAKWVRRQIAESEAANFLDPVTGQSEVSGFWRDGSDDAPIWCRMRADRLVVPGRMPIIYDIKTQTTAAPAEFSRSLWRDRMQVQEGLYRRGARALLGTDTVLFRWIVVERDPPHAVSVVSLDPKAQAIADQDAERAIQAWEQCLKRGWWPGYPRLVCHVEAPGYVAKQYDESDDPAEATRDQFDVAYRFQAGDAKAATPWSEAR